MSDEVTADLADHFAEVDDPRVEYLVDHNLVDIIAIAICGVIAGADTWTDIELFGQSKQPWLKKWLELPNGIPSHDTFGRVFAQIDPEQFQAGFMSWLQAIQGRTEGQIVPIDGKRLRRSHDRANGVDALELVRAWASENRLVLAQVKVAEGSNEIPAISQVLDLLDLTDCTVTIDAIGCQTDIATQIIDQGADYVLALKSNQGRMYASVVDLFDYAEEIDHVDCDYHKTVEKNHGRIEIRECWTISAPNYLDYLPNRSAWPELQTLGLIRSQRRIGDKTTTSVRYYITSSQPDAEQFLHTVRTHWSIENELHWILDVVFREDDSRIRTGHAAENMAVLRQMALHLLKQETTAKVGVKAKRRKAGWDNRYLLKVLRI